LRSDHPQYRLQYQQQLEIVDCVNYLGSLITNDARCTREIKSRIAIGRSSV